MKCDLAALKKHASLCAPILTQLKNAATKQFPPETANTVCALAEAMCAEHAQLQRAIAEYEKTIKKAECYVQSVRLE